MRRKKPDKVKVHGGKQSNTAHKVKVVSRVDNAVHANTADNVFADLGLDDADQLLTRAKLGHSVRMILKKKGLKQRAIAHLLNIDQAEVSKLMNGNYHLFSEGRLFGFLNRLDRKVIVQISPRKKDETPQEVVFA
jgi:predicted XRE-type DNA-binding protein